MSRLFILLASASVIVACESSDPNVEPDTTVATDTLVTEPLPGPDSTVAPEPDTTVTTEPEPDTTEPDTTEPEPDTTEPEPCGPGVSTTTPPGEACTDDLPVITQSGVYDLGTSLSTAVSDAPLACGYTYATKRDVAYRLCLDEPMDVVVRVDLAAHDQPVAIALVDGCRTGAVELACQKAIGSQSITILEVPAGSHDIVIEGYDASVGTLSVTLTAPPIRFHQYRNCAAADAHDPFVWSGEAMDLPILGISGTGEPEPMSCAYYYGPDSETGRPYPSIGRITLPRRAIVTMNEFLSNFPQVDPQALGAGDTCSGDDLFCHCCFGGVDAVTLEAGTHYLRASLSRKKLHLEPAGPDPTNTTCELAEPLVDGLNDLPQTVSYGDRWYAYDHETWSVGLKLTQTALDDVGIVEAYDACDGTKLKTVSGVSNQAQYPTYLSASGVPPGPVYIRVTGFVPGSHVHIER